MTEADRDELRILIEVRLSSLREEDATSAGLREDITLDQQSVGRLSRMDAIQRKAMARATDARRKAETQRLCFAVGRLEDEEFGFCTDCGESIPLARLRIDPSLTRCAECTRGA